MPCSDEWNLPPGLAPSGIPGNSRKEVAVERAMEKAGDAVFDLAANLRRVALALDDAFDDGPEDAQHNIRKVQYKLEEITAKLDDTLNTLGRVLE